MRTSRYHLLLQGVFVALLFCISPFAFGANDTVVRLPLVYDTFMPPPVGGTYTDSVFGVSIKRLSDAPNTNNNAGAGPLPFVSTEYPTASPFNSDNSLLILQHQSYFGLYDWDGQYLQDLPFVVNTAAEPRWSRSDPDALYYVSGNALMKLAVAARTSSLVRRFDEYPAIRGRGESDISPDGDHFVFAGDEPPGPSSPGTSNRYVFVYEISTDTKGPVLDTAGHDYDDLYIASDNSVALGWLPTGTGRFTGVELFDRNMVFKRQLTHALGHMHLTRDVNGDDVLIWNNSNDALPIACQNGIVKVRLSDALQTCLLELDWSLAVHITAPDGHGWVFVGTYDPLDPRATLPGWKTYTNEILQVKLDGTETRRLLHHRSRQTDRYGYQPRAAVSRDGSRLVFTSNYGLQGILGYPDGYTDAYFVAVPAQVPPRVSINDASVIEGDSGTRSLVFTVTLSHPSDLTVSVDYATADLRATAPGDYTAILPTTLSFAPGEASRTITVLAHGDLLFEPTENFYVELTNPVSAVIEDGVGYGTIVDDDGPGGDGLTGDYFANTTLSGLSQTRVDPTVNFDWGTGSPGFGGLGSDDLSIRWSGWVETGLSETYTFCTRTDDGVRLWVNRSLLVDHWAGQAATEWCGAIALQAGTKYVITMEYYENAAAALAQLYWSSPSMPKVIIPQGRLYSRHPLLRYPTALPLDVAARPTPPSASHPDEATEDGPPGEMARLASDPVPLAGPVEAPAAPADGGKAIPVMVNQGIQRGPGVGFSGSVENAGSAIIEGGALKDSFVGDDRPTGDGLKASTVMMYQGIQRGLGVGFSG
ncbi:MAG: hypothetical protein JJE39_09430, partial [Vicinamibacteria bacterium]|nr:hypothetical protein [Vicinamibacteria bacterium]